jgi:hypothetical protein
MADNQTGVASATQPTRRLPLFLLGILFFIAGPAIYAAQFQMRHLTTPWYAPILATMGVLLMVVSVVRRPGILRGIGLVLFALFCGMEWFMVLVALVTPAYSGPAQIGRTLPAFATELADGKTFTDKNLADGTPTVLLFFRGRW